MNDFMVRRIMVRLADRGYALAVGVTALAFLARWILNPILQGDSPFSIFILAVLVSAWRGGLGPGLATLGLGGLSATFFFLHPQWSFQFPGIGEIVHLLVYLAIGTSVCLLGQRMRSAVETAESAVRAKGAFMAYMSHEIRTPINGVLGMLELLGRTRLDGRQERYIHRARDSAELLLSLLNDVLDLTRVELGRLELEEVEYRPLGLLGSVESVFAASAEQKGLRLECRAATGFGDPLGLGDPARIRQVLINLVGNAIKFTDRGEVVVTVDRVGDAPGLFPSDFGRVNGDGLRSAAEVPVPLVTPTLPRNGGQAQAEYVTPTLPRNGGQAQAEYSLSPSPISRPSERETALGGTPTSRSLRFEVRDTGIGIAPEVRERVFAPFTQADSSMSRRFGGSGLGLAISRHLATLMGGSIDFDSTPGLGSTFRFVVPFPEVETTAHAREVVMAERPKGDGSRRVLVVEDNPINAEVAVTLLNDAGYPADLAGSGLEAVEMVGARIYDLVLMDCQLPGLDGFETTRRIRSMERAGTLPGPGGRRLPILALTASATSDVRELCVEAGMDACLSKPIGGDDLLRAVAAALEGRPAGVQAPVAEASPNLKPDLENALRRLDGRADLLARLAGHFLVGSGETIESLRGSVRDRDAETLGQVAHRLKGQASTFDGSAVVEAAARLEMLAKNPDWPEIDATMVRLETALPALVEVLQAFRAAQSP